MIQALIAAGGIGRRLGYSSGKQFLKFLERPLLCYSLDPFQASNLIQNIIIVVEESRIEFCWEEVVKKYDYDKVKNIVAGGKERQDSVYNGLQEIPVDYQTVVIHDGARPLLTVEILEKAIKALDDVDGVIVGVPAKDTLKRVSNHIVQETLSREQVWYIQTPQVFPLKLILEAHQRAKADDFYATDDASLLEKYGYKVKIVEGSYDNIKLTTPEDIEVVEALLKARLNESRNRF